MAGTADNTSAPRRAAEPALNRGVSGALPGRAIVIVADSARARLLTSRSDGSLEEALDLTNPDARLRDVDLVADAAGRRSGNTTSAGHSAFGGGSKKRHRIEEFAAEICDRAEKLQRAIRAQRVYLVAEPEVLGLLRKRAGLPLKRAICGEVAKSLATREPEVIRAVLPPRV